MSKKKNRNKYKKDNKGIDQPAVINSAENSLNPKDGQDVIAVENIDVMPAEPEQDINIPASDTQDDAFIQKIARLEQGIQNIPDDSADSISMKKKLSNYVEQLKGIIRISPHDRTQKIFERIKSGTEKQDDQEILEFLRDNGASWKPLDVFEFAKKNFTPEEEIITVEAVEEDHKGQAEKIEETASPDEAFSQKIARLEEAMTNTTADSTESIGMKKKLSNYVGQLKEIIKTPLDKRAQKISGQIKEMEAIETTLLDASTKQAFQDAREILEFLRDNDDSWKPLDVIELAKKNFTPREEIVTPEVVEDARKDQTEEADDTAAQDKAFRVKVANLTQFYIDKKFKPEEKPLQEKLQSYIVNLSVIADVQPDKRTLTIAFILDNAIRNLAEIEKSGIPQPEKVLDYQNQQEISAFLQTMGHKWTESDIIALARINCRQQEEFTPPEAETPTDHTPEEPVPEPDAEESNKEAPVIEEDIDPDPDIGDTNEPVISAIPDMTQQQVKLLVKEFGAAHENFKENTPLIKKITAFYELERLSEKITDYESILKTIAAGDQSLFHTKTSILNREACQEKAEKYKQDLQEAENKKNSWLKRLLMSRHTKIKINTAIQANKNRIEVFEFLAQNSNPNLRPEDFIALAKKNSDRASKPKPAPEVHQKPPVAEKKNTRKMATLGAAMMMTGLSSFDPLAAPATQQKEPKQVQPKPIIVAHTKPQPDPEVPVYSLFIRNTVMSEKSPATAPLEARQDPAIAQDISQPDPVITVTRLFIQNTAMSSKPPVVLLEETVLGNRLKKTMAHT